MADVISICFVGSNDLYCHCENGDFACFELPVDADKTAPILRYKKNSKKLIYRSEFMIYGSNQKFILSLGWTKGIALVDFKANTF